MADQGYENRQDFEMELWPELRERWNTFLKFVFAGREADKELKQLVRGHHALGAGVVTTPSPQPVRQRVIVAGGLWRR